MSKIETSTGCGGCVSLVLAIILIWALVFGVTIDGKHYGLTECNKKGVQIDTGKEK